MESIGFPINNLMIDGGRLKNASAKNFLTFSERVVWYFISITFFIAEQWNYAAVVSRGICHYSPPAVTHELASLGSAKGVTCVKRSVLVICYKTFQDN
jgi:hypothetical protein